MGDVLKVVMAWTMLIASTVSTVSTAYAVITALTHIRPTGQSKLRESGRFVQYNSNQLDLTNHQDLQDSPIQLDSTNININSNQLEEPPTYLEVSGL